MTANDAAPTTTTPARTTGPAWGHGLATVTNDGVKSLVPYVFAFDAK